MSSVDVVWVDEDWDSLVSSSPNLFLALENLFTMEVFLAVGRRAMEYIWSTLLISHQYEKLLADTHLGIQQFGNAQDTISQTFLEAEQTLPVCFSFCKSG